MNVFNVRKGFATNSSSSHSVVEIKNDSGKFGVVTDEYCDFGWSFFTAANNEAKENYLVATVFSNLRQQIKNDKSAFKELKNIFGDELANRAADASVDHQSVLTLPRNWDNNGLNKEFIKDLLNYFRKDNVVILGGNDNTDEEHSLYDEKMLAKTKDLNRESSNEHYVARKDGNYWTIFSRADGEKVRFSFEEGVTPTKAFAPELADIKITDFCPYDCDFCYQNSTIDGSHAKIENIEKIAIELEKNQVFEVALGGGETTLHPQFIEILKLFKSKNVVPNFTTKNLNLLRQSNIKDIIDSCGAMAFSVQSVDDMLKVKSAYMDFAEKDKVVSQAYSWYSNQKSKSPWNPKITFQMVMGVMDMNEFKKMLSLAEDFGARMTLLGYKENGRGAAFAPHGYEGWLDEVVSFKEKNNMHVSIDTALAAEFEKEILMKNIEPRTFHTNEGAFSVYIDAVKMKFYPSSYVGLEDGKDFNENWLNDYANMNVNPSVKKSIKIGKV